MIELEKKLEEKTLVLHYSFDVSDYIIEDQDYLRMSLNTGNVYGQCNYSTITYAYVSKDKTHYLSQAINHDINEAIQMVMPMIPVRGAMYFGDSNEINTFIIKTDSNDTSYPSLVAHSWFVIGMMNAIYIGYTDNKSPMYKDYTSDLVVGFESDNTYIDDAIRNAVNRYTTATPIVDNQFAIPDTDSIYAHDASNFYRRSSDAYTCRPQDPPKKRGRKKVTITNDGPESLNEKENVDLFSDLFVNTKENKEI